MVLGFGPDMDAKIDEEGIGNQDLLKRWRAIHRAYDAHEKGPAPFHALYDAADAQEMGAAMDADNTVLVHFQFGSSIIATPQGVPRALRLALPRLCLTSFVKRAIARMCPGFIYPSFIRLSLPDTGEVLDNDRTLEHYGVSPGSELLLDIVEGDICEAFDYERLAAYPGAATAATEEDTRRPAPDAAGPQAGTPAVRRAAATAPPPPAGRAPATAPAAAPRDGRAAARQPGDNMALESAATATTATHAHNKAPRPQQGPSGRRPWSREETIAMLEGMLKHHTRWRVILEDSRYSRLLAGRTGTNLKDRWVNLEKAAERNFQGMKYHGADDTELVQLVQDVRGALGKA